MLSSEPVVYNRFLFKSLPFDPEKGTFNIRETIKDIDGLPISAAERQQIYEGNARKLLRMGGSGFSAHAK